MALMAAIGGALIIRAWIYPRSVVGPRLREMLRFGLPVVPVGVFQWIIMSSDRILLGNMTNSSEVGIYAIAWSLISPIGLLTASFAMAYGPFSMSLINHPSSRQVYAKVLTLYSVLGCLLCTAISLFALDIVDLITTPQYHAAAGLIPYLAFSGLSYGAISIAITGLTIAKKTTLIALGTFIGAALNVGLNLILIPSLKKQGAAISFLASTLLSLAAVFFFSQKHYPIPYQFRLAVAFLLLSWCLIGIDSFVLQRMPRSLALGGVRAALCLTFLPAMLRLRILRWENFISFLQFFRRSK
jgi:O-antigen/teichoic acid export membrane protein